MDSETLNNYILTGKIAAQVREYGKSLIKEGSSVLEILDEVERKIFELNAKPAFPAQISLNETAAHYCSEDDDKTILTDQLVSLDVGVHINGCIGDTAITIDLSGKYSNLIKASDKALENALKIIHTGISLGDAFREALGDMKGINRAGYFIFPMDESLAVSAVDISSRPYLSFDVKFSKANIGDLDSELVEDFFQGFVNHLKASLHVKEMNGRTDHHKIEGVFKSVAKAMETACSLDKRALDELPSTKGMI